MHCIIDDNVLVKCKDCGFTYYFNGNDDSIVDSIKESHECKGDRGIMEAGHASKESEGADGSNGNI